MDPMDFTMDDSSNLLAASNAHRYQCQQPQAQSHPQPTGPNSISQSSSQSRDNQHYDPVHESSGWYQANITNGPHRHQFPTPQNIPQWSSPHADPTHNWPHFAEMERAAQSHGYTTQDYRRSYMPWNDAGSFASFTPHAGYNSSSVNGGNGGSEATTLQSRSAAPLRGYEMNQQQFLFQRDMHRPSLPLQYNPSSSNNTTLSELRPASENIPTSSSSEQATTQQPPTFGSMGLRTGYSRATRTSISRYEDILEGPRRRRLAPAWDPDSEEDEDITREMSREVAREREVLYRQHAAEALFGGDLGDDDRSIAAIRGMVAGGKRVISKEALASLESVKVKDLKEADRTCIICYNEFGVSNPEGEIENPIRLPKCKHVFGDKCIKKWFEDSDSCPYCRDKLPSELAVRKGIMADRANQYRLAHREQLRQISLAQREQLRTQMAAQRSRYSYAPAGIPSVPVDSDGSSSATAQQVQDDYDFMMARQAETWLGGRNGTGDSPERRRQARGRHAHTAIRAPHFLGNRPTSVGSARLSNTSFTYQPPTRYTDYGVQPRRNATATAPGPDAREPASEREVGEARESPSDSSVYPNSGPSSSSESSGSAGHTPPRNSRLPVGSSVPVEEASPPVAVGSGVTPRQLTAASRFNFESNSAVTSVPSTNSSSRQSSEQSSSISDRSQQQQDRSQAIPSFGSLLSNNAAARFGSDSSHDMDDLTSIGRVDVGIPRGWGA